MKGSILLKLSILSKPDKNRNKYFYQAMGASSSDLFVINFLKFLRIFIPILIITIIIVRLAFPDFSLIKSIASLIDYIRSLIGA